MCGCLGGRELPGSGEGSSDSQSGRLGRAVYLGPHLAAHGGLTKEGSWVRA